MKKILNSILLVTILIALSPILISIPKCETSTKLSIIPPSIVDPSLSIGQEFIVNVTVEDVVDLYTWQVQVFFDPSIINCTNAWIPAGSPFDFAVDSPIVIDPTEGWVSLGSSKLGEVPGTSGNGTLASIQFKVMGVGSSGIDFSTPYGTQTFLLNSALSLIPAEIYNGYFNNWTPPPPATIRIIPPKIINPTLTQGSYFDINITIENATDIYEWGMKIFYIKDILNITQAVESSFLKNVGTTLFQANINNNYNDTHGLITMNCTLTDATSGANGNGTLATVTFKVEGLGESPINIVDSALFNPQHFTLPHNKFDGYFSNILKAKLSVYPEEVKGPEYVPCTTFTINITVENVLDMKKCIFNVSYNPAVIMEISITFFKVSGQLPRKSLVVNDTAGFIWISLEYPTSISTLEPIPLVMIEFHVEALGISPIDLHDTALKDSYDLPIPHNAVDGIFIGLIRDVSIVNVTASPNIVYQGWIVYINITAKNEGNITETFTVKAFFNSNVIGEYIIADLDPGNETSVIILWNTSTAEPCHNYTISVEAMPVPYEIDLTDNEFIDGHVKVKYMGDVNGDGMVNMMDISIICAAFGSFPGHPRWVPEADLIQDNVINMRDIALACLNFLKQCT